MRHFLISAFFGILLAATSSAADSLVFDGFDGPGKGKHIVLISGDEEYRSEETIPQLAKILAKHHGFKCTVLFAIDKKDGTINPLELKNIPGLEALKTADLMVIFTRFRDLPDDQMKHIVDYLETGKPVVGLRTATHAFNPKTSKTYAFLGNDSKEPGWEGGFGKRVLGEKWVAHHAKHGVQGTRGIVVKGQENNPILRGIKSGDIFGTTDVYRVNLPLPGDSKPLVLGQATESLKSDSKAVEGKVNDPMMPVAWTKTYSIKEGKTGRVFTTTMGAAQDFASEGTAPPAGQRLLLGAGSRRSHSRQGERGHRRQVRADAVQGRCLHQGRQTLGPRDQVGLFSRPSRTGARRTIRICQTNPHRHS